MTTAREGGRTGVLLMGYGSPSGPDELPGYLAEVMGRPPDRAVVEEYVRRYERIGWSPQMRILRSIREKLERRLKRAGRDVPVLLGTKHWEPHVRSVIAEAAEAGVERLVAVPLSPYASTWIRAPYERAIAEGRARARTPVEVEMRPGWHLHPAWIRYWSETVAGELRRGPASTAVLLSAHSLPERMQRAGDPYPGLVRATADAVAGAAALPSWDFTYQSAGNTTEPWLGPDITEKMVEWRDRGHPEQLVAPIGFVFEHLEVLYDLDVVIREFADRHGVGYRRAPMPNDDDRLVEALATTAFPEPGAPGTGGTGPEAPGGSRGGRHPPARGA